MKGSTKGKDPAVSWFFNDWHGGTMTLSRFLKGCYMDLLVAQFNNGHMALDEVKTVLGSDFGQTWPTLQKKFTTDSAGLFFNERLDNEISKRKQYSESRSKNKKGKGKSYDNHMGIGNGIGIGYEEDNGVMYYRRFAHLKLTLEEFDKLVKAGLSKEDIDSYCDSIENYKKNTNYTSLYLTILSWKRTDKKKSGDKNTSDKADDALSQAKAELKAEIKSKTHASN